MRKPDCREVYPANATMSGHAGMHHPSTRGLYGGIVLSELNSHPQAFLSFHGLLNAPSDGYETFGFLDYLKTPPSGRLQTEASLDGTSRDARGLGKLQDKPPHAPNGCQIGKPPVNEFGYHRRIAVPVTHYTPPRENSFPGFAVDVAVVSFIPRCMLPRKQRSCSASLPPIAYLDPTPS